MFSPTFQSPIDTKADLQNEQSVKTVADSLRKAKLEVTSRA